jgi:hypothetical protein
VDDNNTVFLYSTTHHLVKQAMPTHRRPAPLAPHAKANAKPMVKTTTAQYSRVIKKLSPGQRGTVKLQRRYGPALLCVRYRDDLLQNQRYTTVELIVETRPLNPNYNPTVQVPIGLTEAELRHRACQMGAKWNESHDTWDMPLKTAKRLNLLHRVVHKRR